MQYDKDKVDEMTLALLYLVMSRDRDGGRAWKAFDWDILERLRQKGWISDLSTKGPTVGISTEGMKKAEELFRKHFQSQGRKNQRRGFTLLRWVVQV